MTSTAKFVLGFTLSLAVGTGVLTQPTEPTAGWFGNCLICKWDPWGGPAFCAVTSGAGWWGCYASGYKCQQGGTPCGKKAPTPTATGPVAPTGTGDLATR
jgi:hypothetical protein